MTLRHEQEKFFQKTKNPRERIFLGYSLINPIGIRPAWPMASGFRSREDGSCLFAKVLTLPLVRRTVVIRKTRFLLSRNDRPVAMLEFLA